MNRLFTEQVNPGKFILHTANPIFREKIQAEGILPMVGDSYSCHHDYISLAPAVFAVDSETTPYESTWDDDVWKINTEKANVTWYKDHGCYIGCIVSYDAIPVDCITFIHEGTGITNG